MSDVAGDSVDVSPVMGKGFPIAQLPADKFSTILMFATGSGIAPVKALIESPDLQVPPSRPALAVACVAHFVFLRQRHCIELPHPAAEQPSSVVATGTIPDHSK